MGESNGGTGMADRIERKLTEALTPLRVRIVADAFVGQSRVARQRLVYQALSEELQERVHALTLRTFTPDEDPREH